MDFNLLLEIDMNIRKKEKIHKKRISILYVEDDFKLGNETKQLLDNMFQRVDYAYDGVNGLELYDVFLYENGVSYDLVITDIKMPRMCGLELAKKILSQNKSQKIVVVSSIKDASTMIELINLGNIKFIEKPFHWKKLITIVDRLFEEIVEKNIFTEIQLEQNLFWNPFEKKLKKENEIIPLSYNQMAILDLFIKNPNTIFSDIDLFIHIENKHFGRKFSQNTVKSIIKRLREKLPIGIIHNVYGMGYKFIITK